MELDNDSLESFAKLCCTEPALKSMDRLLKHGLSEADALKAVILTLCAQKSSMADELRVLNSIAPKRIRVGTKVYRWDAPDNLVPITQVAASAAGR